MKTRERIASERLPPDFPGWHNSRDRRVAKALQSSRGRNSRFQRGARYEARSLRNVGTGPNQPSPDLGIGRELATWDGEGQAVLFRMGSGTGLSWIDLGSAWSLCRGTASRVDGPSRALGSS